MALRFVILGGGPAGNTAATHAVRLGADVTIIEKNVIGGAAHLWDCIPSKAMIATGGALAAVGRTPEMGLTSASVDLDPDALKARIQAIEQKLEHGVRQLLDSQGVRIIRGAGRFAGPHTIVADTTDGDVEVEADVVLLATGSRPRLPDWAVVDGERVLSTRDAYPPPVWPDHLVVIGSGVTGVEFVHMFSSLGSDVTLIVSRQQVLPQKDSEVAAALEDELLRRGVRLYKGARAIGIDRLDGGVAVRCDDGRTAEGSHTLLAIGSVPNSEGLGLDAAGVEADGNGYVPVDEACRTNAPHIYAAGDLSGKLPLSSVAAMQGRRIAEHVMGVQSRTRRQLDYDKAASAIFTVPEIADVGLAEADAFADGRKVRVTKVPFSASPKALIESHSRGFVKIVSDPATGVVLGGSIVGRHAAELISVIAVAVTNGLRVADIVDSLLVHPSLSEALAEAAEVVPALTSPALVTALLLAMAGAQKLLDPTMTVGALHALHLPSSRWLVRIGSAAELALGVAAIVVGGEALWWAVAASYVAFGAFVLAALRKGTMIGSCGCFGREETPPHGSHVVLNAGLAGLASLVAVGSPDPVLEALANAPATAAGVIALSAVALYLLHAAFVELPRTLTAAR